MKNSKVELKVIFLVIIVILMSQLFSFGQNNALKKIIYSGAAANTNNKSLSELQIEYIRNLYSGEKQRSVVGGQWTVVS